MPRYKSNSISLTVMKDSTTGLRPKIALIVAAGINGEIGIGGRMIWHLPADLKYFKRTTLGAPVIMGRKTWESLPRKPLPGRLNIVVTRSEESTHFTGAHKASSIEQAITLCGEAERVFIIGGGELYQQTMPIADEVYLTRIIASSADADTYFPEVSFADFKPVSVSEEDISEEGIRFRFEVHHRRTPPLKVTFISKSDSKGGAAVVTRRLTDALRSKGVDAEMLVAEKETSLPYVSLIASPAAIKMKFLLERLKIFKNLRFNRKNLFKIDTASDGIDLSKDRRIAEADVICPGWVNQGVLSLKGVKKLGESGKPIIWTMHDMWCFTGICHHAGKCTKFTDECGDCPLLPSPSHGDLSRLTWHRKKEAYNAASPAFVAVSRWLADKAIASGLLKGMPVSVIPNPFEMPDDEAPAKRGNTIVIGAAGLDNPVKGFPIFIEMTRELARRDPTNERGLNVITFGAIKNPSLLREIALPATHLGVITDIASVYRNAAIVVSSSYYETLPGTLVEAHAYGAVPVSFNRGGQSDIIDHLKTGYIAEISDDIYQSACRLADGVEWALANLNDDIRKEMRESVRKKFDADTVAEAYLRLMRETYIHHLSNRKSEVF